MDIAELGYKIDAAGIDKGVSSMRKLTSESQRAETASGKLELQLNRMTKVAGAAGLAIVAGATVVGATVGKWTRDVVRLGNELDQLSKIANTSSQQLQGWGYGAQSVGVSTEKLADILKDTEDKVGDFIATGGGPLKDFFKDIAPRVGLTADQFARLSGPEALAAYYTALQRSNLSQAETIHYMEDLSSDSAKLIPLLRDNAKGFRDWAGEADNLGAIIDQDTMKAIQGMREQSTRLDVVMDGLKVTLAKELLPPFERFTDLLAEPRTQAGIRSLTQWLGQAAGAAVTFAEKIGAAANAYREFVANQGGLPADMLGSTKQIDERIRKLSGMAYGDDLLSSIQRGIFGDTITEELKKAIAERNAFQWRNVQGGSSSSYERMVSGSGIESSGGKKGKSRELPDFASDARDELEKLIEQEARARDEFDAWAAQLKGPVAEANFRYTADLKQMGELAKTGAISTGDLKQAQELLRQEHEADIDAIERRLNPGRELLRQLEFEKSLIGMTNAERATAIQLRDMDAKSVQLYGDAIARANQEIENSRRTTDAMDSFRSSAENFLVDLPKRGKDAWRDFLDDLEQQISRWASRGVIEQLFGAYGTNGQGTAAGGWLSMLIGAFTGSGGFTGASGSTAFGYSSYGGGRAFGGNVYAGQHYRVGEGDRPELLDMGRGRQYLIPGDSGRVEPVGRYGSERPQVNVNQTINVTGKVDTRTANQIARATEERQRLAWARR